jgi:hypothetical protein
VLGNERQALYLRDWLRALELEFVTSPLETSGPTQKTKGKSKGKSASLKAKEVRRDLKRPRIVRAVEKRRGRKKLRIESEEEDDWIVESDEFSDYDIADGDSDDDFRGEAGIQDQNETALDQPPDDVDSSYTAHDFRVKLTNTILIAGPPGCGKTAAVYACADELGWEVFEVYPGIGKRSASSLDNLVGDVGKNHLVRNAQQPARQDAFTVIQSMKGREKAGDEMPSKATGNEEKPIEIEDTEDRSRHGTGSTSVDDFGFIAVSDPTPSGVGLNEGQATAVVRQSMVLFEEVDILFKDDSTFWPAVISLIKDCKRPVIMTCNG